MEKSGYSDWLSLGRLQKKSLSSLNFDDYFRESESVAGWQETPFGPEKLRLDNRSAWSLIVEDRLYYVLQQRSGEVFLANGYTGTQNDNSQGSIRWLFKLRIIDSEEVSQPSATPSPEPSDYSESVLGSFHIAPATDALLGNYTSYHEFINDTDGERLLIRTDAEIKDFAFTTIDFEESDGELTFHAGDKLFSVDELKPEKPFVVKLLIPGSLPAYGISFTDESGIEHLYSINLSGRGPDEAPPYFLLEE